MDVVTISYEMPFHLGSVNCYLIKTAKGFLLVDSGFAKCREALEKTIRDSGCLPGNLNLILVTHADGDHVGNCAYLRERFGAKIAIHPLEANSVSGEGRAENRKERTRAQRAIDKMILGAFSLILDLGEAEKFKADLLIEEGFDLSPWGLAAKVIHLPGHSRGSIGILCESGEFFCGDFLSNLKRPSTHFIKDSVSDYETSLGKLKSLAISTVYPGHGEPFAMAELIY